MSEQIPKITNPASLAEALASPQLLVISFSHLFWTPSRMANSYMRVSLHISVIMHCICMLFRLDTLELSIHAEILPALPRRAVLHT